MNIKYVEAGKGTLSIDPLIIFERFNAVITDIAFAGTLDKIRKIFHPEPNKEPFISIPKLLQRLTKLLNSDLEKENPPRPGFFKKAVNNALPPILRSTKDAVHDPVIRIFWPNLQELLLDILEIVKEAGMPVATLTTTPIPLVASAVKKALPEVLFRKYGISQALTKFLINLCKDDDFWDFVLALKQWLERHHVHDIKALAKVSSEKLTTLDQSGSLKPLEAPKENEIARLDFPKPSTPKAISLELEPARCSPAKNRLNGIKAEVDPGFFARRKRSQQQSPVSVTPQSTATSSLEFS